MDTDTSILSEPDRERQMPYDITYMQNLKCDMNELIYKTEAGSQTQRTDSCCQGGRVVKKRWIGSLGLADANDYIQDG